MYGMHFVLYNLAHGSFDELLRTSFQEFVIQWLYSLVQHAFGRSVDWTAVQCESLKL